MEFGIIGSKKTSTAYVTLYELIDTWFLNSNRMGVWSLPWRWHILSIPLTTGRGAGAKTCVFAPDDLCSRPEAQMIVTFGICFKQHFDSMYLVFYNPSSPRMFLSLDLLSEYWIQYGAIRPLYFTSSYSTWIFCKGVSGFATDCHCEVWCRGLNTCLLHVGPPFGNRFLSTSRAVGLTYWKVCLNFFLYFDICNYICLDTSYHNLALSLLRKYSLYFQVLLY